MFVFGLVIVLPTVMLVKNALPAHVHVHVHWSAVRLRTSRCGFTVSGSLASQLASKGSIPSAVGSMYTMPQRLTVAGDATARSSTSNIMVMLGDMAMISPDTRHSFLLSSSTAGQRANRQSATERL